MTWRPHVDGAQSGRRGASPIEMIDFEWFADFR